YAAYSPIFMTAALCMSCFVSFASFGAIFTHTILWFGRDIVRRFRSSLKDERDIHSRLMQQYAEVPTWWYMLVGVISTVFIFIAIEIFPTRLPIWAAALHHKKLRHHKIVLGPVYISRYNAILSDYSPATASVTFNIWR
ncbi:OPT oligopeptide transporter protein-domain-containing protein, partial [Mycena vitilis]